MSLRISKMNSPNTGWNDEDFSTMEIDLIKTGGVADEGGAGDDLEVTESSPQAMSVEVNTGVAYVEITKGGRTWRVRVKNTAVETVVIGQNISGQNRIDALILRVSVTTTPDATATNVATLQVIQGTPAGSPSAPSDGTIQAAIGSDGFIRLANVEVDNGVGQIFNADIIDTRVALEWGVESSGVETVFRGSGANLSGVVHSSGNETIAGIKSFSSFPVTPSSDPTTDYEVANKQFVENYVADNQNQYSDLTAGESINGSSNALPVAQLGKGRDAIYISGSSGFGYWTGYPIYVNMGGADSSYKRAQSFTYTNARAQTIKVKKIIPFIKKAGTPADNVYFEIFNDSASKPGAVIPNGTTATLGGGSLTNTSYHHDCPSFTFAVDPTITSGSRYWVVFERSGLVDGSNYYQWLSANANTYASEGSSAYTASGGTWYAMSATDLQVYIELEIDGQGRIYKLDADNKDGLKFIGFTKDNVALGDPISVQNGLEIDTLTGIENGDDLFGSTTAGAYSKTPPTSAEDTAVVHIARATGSAKAVINPLGTYRLYSAAFGDGKSQMQFAGVTATYAPSFFIKTGFRPKTVECITEYQTRGGATTYPIFNHQKKYDVGSLWHNEVELDNSSQYVNAQSQPSSAVNALFQIGTFLENGFYIAPKGSGDSSTPNFYSIKYIVEG